MVLALIAMAGVLVVFLVAFVAWVYRLDRDMQKLINDAEHRRFIPGLPRVGSTRKD